MIFSFVALSALHSNAQDIDCSNEDDVTQMKMNFCASEQFEAEDANLNTVWAELKSAMENGEAGYDFELSFKPLLAGQKAWIIYRDKQCEAEGTAFEGGTAQPQIVADCLARMTQARSSELSRMMEE